MTWMAAVLRLNLFLMLVTVLCAIGTVSAQHQWRTLFQELETEQEYTQRLEIEYGQLQLELSAWATHPRIEKIAREKLHMQTPDISGIFIIDSEER